MNGVTVQGSRLMTRFLISFLIDGKWKSLRLDTSMFFMEALFMVCSKQRKVGRA